MSGIRGRDFYIPADIVAEVEAQAASRRACGVVQVVRDAAVSCTDESLHAVTFGNGQTELVQESGLEVVLAASARGVASTEGGQ